MFDQEELAQQFEQLLTQQEMAEHWYASLDNTKSSKEFQREIQELHRDKKRHIELTRRLLEIVE